MALAFWIEPVPTYDLDVLGFLPPSEEPLVSLRPIYGWAFASGYVEKDEHVLIEGLPVQFLPSHNELVDEAVQTAETLDYFGVAVRVVRPEYLTARHLSTPSRRLSTCPRRSSPPRPPAPLAIVGEALGRGALKG